MDTIRFEYESFFENGGFKTAYLIYRRRRILIPERHYLFDLAKAKQIQEDCEISEGLERVHRRLSAEDVKRNQEVYDLMDAIFALIQGELIVNRYRNKTGCINMRRINWPQIIDGYYGEEKNLQECGAASSRTKNNILAQLLDLIERNPHKEKYDFHKRGIETIRGISRLQLYAAERERISDAFAAFYLYYTKSIGDLTERLEELSSRLEDVRNAVPLGEETKICRVSSEKSKVYWETKRKKGEFIYMLLAGNEAIDKGEEPFFYVENKAIEGKQVQIVASVGGEINKMIPAKASEAEHGVMRIYIDVPPKIAKYELIKDGLVIRRGQKPEFYLNVDPEESSKYYIRPVIDEATIETLLHFANVFHVKSDLTDLLANTSTLTTIYKYYFLISRSIQVIEKYNPRTYKKMEACARKQDTHKTDAFTTLSGLLIDFSEI